MYKPPQAVRELVLQEFIELRRSMPDTVFDQLVQESATAVQAEVPSDTGSTELYGDLKRIVDDIRRLLSQDKPMEAVRCCTHQNAWDTLTSRVYHNPQTKIEVQLAAILWQALHDATAALVAALPVAQSIGEFYGDTVLNLFNVLGDELEQAVVEQYIDHLRQYTPASTAYNLAQTYLELLGEEPGPPSVT